MINPAIWRRAASLGLLSALVAVGCSGDGAGDANPGLPDLSAKVPVNGIVTVQGKPLAEAVVTFLPDRGATGVGETDEEGRYTLESYGTPGLLPGDYKVAISYLVSAKGEPQGLGPRSAMTPPPSMFTTTEYLPDEYSNLGKTKLTATVGPKGGTFNFDIKSPLVIPAVKKAEGIETDDSTDGSPTPPAKPSPSGPTPDEPARPVSPADETPAPSSPPPAPGATKGPG